jgi:purine-nucleoside phosphorylase
MEESDKRYDALVFTLGVGGSHYSLDSLRRRARGSTEDGVWDEYFSEVVEVEPLDDVRGYHGSGEVYRDLTPIKAITKEGKKILFCPLKAMASREGEGSIRERLPRYADLASLVILIGYTGSTDEGAEHGDVYLPQKATTSEKFASESGLGHHEGHTNEEVRRSLLDKCESKGLRAKEIPGIITLYNMKDSRKQDLGKLKEEGYHGRDLELAYVLSYLNSKGIPVGALLAVADRPQDPKSYTSDESSEESKVRRELFKVAIEKALEE